MTHFLNFLNPVFFFKATNLQDDLDILKSKSENALMAQDEVDDLRQRLSKTQNDLNLSMGENDRLSEELTRQQALYTELKKMRGRGEEMDMLQELEQVKNRLYDRMGCPKFLLYIYNFFFDNLGFKRGSKAHRISGTRTWKSIFAN